MQAIAPALLQAVTIAARPYVLGKLMPTQDKLDLKTLNGKNVRLEPLMRDVDYLVAWSELRSSGRDESAKADELIAFAAERRWRNRVLDWAEAYQAVVVSDWKRFKRAYKHERWGLGNCHQEPAVDPRDRLSNS